MNVLVVDDSLESRMAICGQLDIISSGMSLDILYYKTVSTGMECLHEMTCNLTRYDIIFMDIKLPDIDGIECMELIRDIYVDRKWREPFMVGMSGNVDRGTIFRVRDAGAVGYLLKPVMMRSVRDWIMLCR